MGLLLTFGSISVSAAENCKQATLLLSVRKESSVILNTLNPINSAFLTSDGDLKKSIESIRGSDFINTATANAIDAFDQDKINSSSIGEGLSNYIKEAGTRCLKIEEVLKLIDDFEKLKVSSPSYKNIAKSMIDESKLQDGYRTMIQADIELINGTPTESQILDFLSKYHGNTKEIALDHANTYLDEVNSNIKILEEVVLVLKDKNFDEIFEKVNTSLDSAIEKLYATAELSKE